MEIHTKELMKYIRNHFALDWQGIHGVPHWARVLRNGLEISKQSGADMHVVRLFALLHDSCRENDWKDPEHGYRAADLSVELLDKYFTATEDQMILLIESLCGHSEGMISKNPTIQTCWDADRLDLGRVGKYPDENYLSLHAVPFIDIAYKWSIGFSYISSIQMEKLQNSECT